jgi:PAS domain S-box-containing protein
MHGEDAVGRFNEVPIPLIEHPILDRLVPPNLQGEGNFDELRARLFGLSSIAVTVWGPIFGAGLLLLGEWYLGLMCFIFSIIVMVIPLILRWTGSFALASAMFSGILWVVVTFFSFYSGGHDSPLMSWYMLAPIIAHIFGSRCGFLTTLGLAISMPFVFWGLEQFGFDFGWTITGYPREMMWILSTTGLILIIAPLFVFNTGIQKWLALIGRRRGEEKRAVEVELHQAQQRALEQSQESLHNLMENSSDGIVAYHAGRVLATNQAFRSMLGHSGEAALAGTMLAGMVSADERVAFRDMLDKIERSQETSYQEFCFMRADGAKLVAEVSGLHGAFEGESAGYCVFRDITERKKMQGKMMQLDRMNAVGTLAAGVAHEINNPLAYVHSNAEYLLTMTRKYRPTADGSVQDVLSNDDVTEARGYSGGNRSNPQHRVRPEHLLEARAAVDATARYRRGCPLGAQDGGESTAPPRQNHQEVQ